MLVLGLLVHLIGFSCSQAQEKECWKEQCVVDKSEFSFYAVGDWGGLTWGGTTPQQISVASELIYQQKHYPAEFMLALGDNMYLTGVNDENDPRFKKTFEDVYPKHKLNIPWYLVAGNHDHYGNAQAQVLYSKQNQRWKFPDLYYSLSYKAQGFTVDFIMIDTAILCGNSEWNPDLLARWFDSWSAAIHGMKIDVPPKDVEKSEAHWKWLEDKLSKSKATYLFVAGHFPVYSIGEHGPHECLVNRLKPLLHRYRVTAYLSGHDHNFQHFKVTDKGWTVDYMVNGLGAMTDDKRPHESSVPKMYLQKFHPQKLHRLSISDTGAFLRITLNKARANIKLLDGWFSILQYWHGSTLYETNLSPRPPAASTTP